MATIYSYKNLEKKEEEQIESEILVVDETKLSELCKHGVCKEMCPPCDRIAAFKELEPFAMDYREALARHRRLKKDIPKTENQVKESDVCPQFMDFLLVDDYKKRLMAIESKHYAAEIRFKRIIRLSYGIKIPRACVGILLTDDCVTDVLNCIPFDNVKLDYKTLLENGKKADSHWISVNNFLIYIPQIQINEKKKRKENISFLEQKINYEIITVEKDLFR